jgi:radical SAM protein with 4Fe4S-binding SPASM domain
MHGEPTMHTDLPSIIRTFRKYLPRNQLMVTSNGGGLLKNAPDSTLALFSAGLNILALDYYERVNIVPKLLEKLPSTLQVKHYPQDGLDLSPHRRWPTNTKVVLVMQDIEAASAGGHSTLNNHCGAGAPLNNSGDGKRCAKPFRELSFRWDGNVSCCCNDFRGVYQIGNIHDMTLKELWNHERFVAIRKALYHGQRFYGACKGCDALSTRVGLLPDKYGKQSLPEPSAEDIELMRKASVGSYTPIVLRAWEK